jgi:predicted nucleotide-binding protein (sugar kinase/HSP70/actin superfamily)
MAKFTKEMREKYTVLIPSMLDFHMQLFKGIFIQVGFKAEIMTNEGEGVVNEGLKYVHNDICYPALLVIGQCIDNLKNRENTDDVAILISQTGGGCRASNYKFLLKKALKAAGFDHVPILAFNFSELHKVPEIGISYGHLLKVLQAVFYGDMLMYLHNKTRSYEVVDGSSKALTQKWIDILMDQFSKNRGISFKDFKKNAYNIARDFDNLEVDIKEKPRVGIVGEIYIKYAALGNNHLEELLVNLGSEICVPGLMGFVYYCLYNFIFDYKLYKKGFLMSIISKILINYSNKREKVIIDAIKTTKYEPMQKFSHTLKLSDGILDHGTKMGEGWLLTAEMVELVQTDYENIVCAQPFGCLPNHICGKGVMKKIKQKYPYANIVAIDYDPSATRVNQDNRIKLMLSIARENLKKKSSNL